MQDQRFEIICRVCGHVQSLAVETLLDCRSFTCPCGWVMPIEELHAAQAACWSSSFEEAHG